MAIQNDNTLLSKGDLKAYHEKILPYLGGNFMLGTNNSTYYSPEERIIGAWSNAAGTSLLPLYQKTFYFTTPSSQGIYNVGTIATGAEPKHIFGGVKWGTGSFIELNYTDQQASTSGFCFSENAVLKVVIRDDDLLSRTCFLTVQYTKNTDVANSAVTTPGCYDINRPDLWPANKEIFFGNGLYGWRATGNMPAINAGSASSIDHGFGTTTAKLVNWGGGYEVLNANGSRCFRMVGHSVGTSTQTVCISDITIGANGHVISVISLPTDHSTTSQKYDIWCTYTK